MVFPFLPPHPHVSKRAQSQLVQGEGLDAPTLQLAPHIPQRLAPVEMGAPACDTGLPLRPRPLETPALLLQPCNAGCRHQKGVVRK